MKFEKKDSGTNNYNCDKIENIKKVESLSR